MNEFSNAKYVSVRTFKGSGDPVATPVWPIVIEDTLYFGTPAHTHKVKRISNNPRVEVAASDSRGTTTGPWRPGSARLITPYEFRAAKRSIDRRHPIAARLLHLFARLRRWDYIGIEIVATTPEPQ